MLVQKRKQRYHGIMEKGPVGGGRGKARGLICMCVSSVFHGIVENDSVSGTKGRGGGFLGGREENQNLPER
jgi:hypothetical protein